MKKILIIEDEPSVRDNLLELLEEEKFNVHATENGIAGVQVARIYLPDLIICDVMMPKLDGYGVIQALRQNPLTATIPFIFLTAKGDLLSLRRGMSLGSDDYLSKPFKRKDLLQAIATRLEKKAVVEEQQTQKLNELRSSITHSLPHELRTPLNGIIGSAQLMLTEYESLKPLEVQEILQDILTSGMRLHKLIQNFLLHAELKLIATNSEQVELFSHHQTHYAKETIASQALQEACAANRESDLRLELTESKVQISSHYLNKIVAELVSNAFKFSESGTPVTVTSNCEGSIFILSICDKGRGMKPEQVASIGAYQQFERKLYEQQGNGLGLTLAKQLTELYKGKLTIRSVPNHETTVLVILPTCRDLN